MDPWTGHSTDVLLSTVAQVLPVFLLAMAADAIATRFAATRPAVWFQRILYLNIGYLMTSEFLMVWSLSMPEETRVAPGIVLIQLAAALAFSYCILLLRWQGNLAKKEAKVPTANAAKSRSAKPGSRKTRKNGRR